MQSKKSWGTFDDVQHFTSQLQLILYIQTVFTFFSFSLYQNLFAQQ